MTKATAVVTGAIPAVTSIAGDVEHQIDQYLPSNLTIGTRYFCLGSNSYDFCVKLSAPYIGLLTLAVCIAIGLAVRIYACVTLNPYSFIIGSIFSAVSVVFATAVFLFAASLVEDARNSWPFSVASLRTSTMLPASILAFLITILDSFCSIAVGEYYRRQEL